MPVRNNIQIAYRLIIDMFSILCDINNTITTSLCDANLYLDPKARSGGLSSPEWSSGVPKF
jgi:hypothetical protein